MATLIYTEADLQACYLNPTYDYELANDITITANFRPYMINNYSGTFDGKGFTIYDLQITPTANGVGLIKSTVAGATIQNINFANVSIATTSYNQISAVCGNNVRATIDNCHILSGSIGANYQCGGIAGYTLGGTISNCTNAASLSIVNGRNGLGGIVGFTTGTTTATAYITNCSNSGTLTTTTTGQRVGGIVGWIYCETYITDCSNSGEITCGNYAGGIVGGGNFTYVTHLDGCSNSAYINGGQRTGGIVGDTQAELKDCYNTGNINGYQYYCGGICGVKRGNYDMTNCYSTGDIDYTTIGHLGGLVGYLLNNCTLTNCRTYDCNIDASVGAIVGGLVGSVNTATCYFVDCWSSATINANHEKVGGLIGVANQSVNCSGCYFSGEIICTGATYANDWGGFVGRCYNSASTFTDCYASSGVAATGVNMRYRGGGFVGTSFTGDTFTRCYATGDVQCSGGNGGGFVGYAIGTFTDCYSTGSVIGGNTTTSVGGFVGFIANNSTFTNCYAKDGYTYVNSSGESIGGFAGSTNTVGTISLNKCYTEIVLYQGYDPKDCGGFIGRIQAGSSTTIDNCYCTGSVGLYSSVGVPHNGARYRAGGFIGRMDAGTIKRCYATGDFKTWDEQAGGFAAYAVAGTINDCYSTGEYVGTDTDYIGNFCGCDNGVTINNCGCYDDGSHYALAYSSGSLTYEKTDPTEWYNATEDVYDTGTYVWDFSTPVWYEWTDDYPKFEGPEISDVSNAIFFGCSF
jgi:hypothetical protein